MADQNDSVAAADGTSMSSVPAAGSGADEAIRRLSEEKKILEGKNKKLAAMLNLCARNANAGKDAREPPVSGPAETGGIKEQMLLLKKQISDVEKKLEKSISAQSSEQWNAVMAELKSRFSSVDEKVSALDGIRAMQKKLEELEAEIRDRRRRGGNPFGKLGSLGAGGNAAAEDESEDDDVVKKIDELEMKIEKLGNRISGSAFGTGTGQRGFMHRTLNMLPSTLRSRVEQVASRFLDGQAVDAVDSRQDAGADADGQAREPPEAATPKIAGITFEPVEEKVSEEVLENLIFDNADALKGKMRIKFHEPSDFGDVAKIQEDIRAKDLLLVNIRQLRQNDMELLKRIVGQLKKTCTAVGGSIIGIGDNYLIVMPRNVQVHKEEK